jgi:methionyl-tRNA formyltransferase
MKIAVLSDALSWKNPEIAQMAERLRVAGHLVACSHEAETVAPSDILFILGFWNIVPPGILTRNRTNVVVHESALPQGRGWSPVTWQVIEGAKVISLTLFEAVEKVDSGKIYLRSQVKLQGNELLPEIHSKVAGAMRRLCEEFIQRYPAILEKGIEQRGKVSYYPRRKPVDSRLDPKKSIAQQFDLLRTVDNEAYPAYFTLRGSTYLLKIEKKKS